MKLTGTEKQIAWATEILNSQMDTIREDVERCKARGSKRAEKFQKLLDRYEAALENEIEAGIVITHRDADLGLIEAIEKFVAREYPRV